MYQAKTIPEAVRQFEIAASSAYQRHRLPSWEFHSRIDKDWRESKNTAGHYYRNNSRDQGSL